ncbi:hypothetical protein D3C72_1568540 [compost metagenome]
MRHGASNSAGTTHASRPIAEITADSASGGTGCRSRRFSRINSPSHTIAASTSALPTREPCPCAPAGSATASTPAVASAIATSSGSRGRSPSNATAISAVTTGKVPIITEASAALVSRSPEISSAV